VFKVYTKIDIPVLGVNHEMVQALYINTADVSTEFWKGQEEINGMIREPALKPWRLARKKSQLGLG
jgi:hypothetical protein